MLTLGFLAASCAAQTPATVYDQALSLVQQGQPERAVALLEKNPGGDLKAGNLLGIALLNAGRKDDAAAQFRKVLAINPAFAPALKNLGVASIARGQTAEAKDAFDRLLRIAPDDPVANLYLGEIAFRQSQYREAASRYERSGGLHLKQADFTLHYAKASIESGNRDAAVKALTAIPAGAQFEAGVLLAAAGAYAEAVEHFRSAQEDPAKAYDAGFNVVLSSLKAGDSTGAVKAGERMIAAGHRTAELYNLLSRAYEQTGNIQGASDGLRTAIAIDPKAEMNYIDLMSLAVRQNQLALGLEIADAAPKSFAIRLQRGAILALMGRPGEAEAVYLEATRLEPENNLGYIALAMVQIQSGKVPEAIELLRARRQRTPADYLANLYLGEALSRQGNSREAIEALTAARQANSRAAAPRALLGKLFSASGELERAAAELEAALRLEPDSAAPAYQLAMVYRKLGKRDQADRMLELYERTKSAGEGDLAIRELLKLLQPTAR